MAPIILSPSIPSSNSIFQFHRMDSIKSNLYDASFENTTGAMTVSGDGHAPPLSASGKAFSLAVILLSPPVRFPALTPIKPQAPPLVCSPANSGGGGSWADR